MQTNSRFLNDIAKVAGGAASTLTGVKEEVEGLARQRLEKVLDQMDLVTRDEFDAVKAMASKARAEQEKLEARLAELEAQVASEMASKPAPKSRAKASTAKASTAKTKS